MANFLGACILKLKTASIPSNEILSQWKYKVNPPTSATSEFYDSYSGWVLKCLTDYRSTSKQKAVFHLFLNIGLKIPS